MSTGFVDNSQLSYYYFLDNPLFDNYSQVDHDIYFVTNLNITI
jgi:hypothetical protein